MSKPSWRSWRIAVPLLVIMVGLTVAASASFASSKAGVIRVAIMTDCKGAFSFGYDYDIGGAQAAFAQYAHGKVKNKNKPTAGITVQAFTTKLRLVEGGLKQKWKCRMVRFRVNAHGETVTLKPVPIF